MIPEWSSAPPIPGGFAAKLSPDGTSLAWSTYIFTDQNGVPGLALDGAGGAYLAGTTLLGVAVTPSAPQPCSAGGTNFYVAHLNQNGALVDRTYAGTDNFTTPYGYARAPLGLAYAGGGALLRHTRSAHSAAIRRPRLCTAALRLARCRQLRHLFLSRTSGARRIRQPHRHRHGTRDRRRQSAQCGRHCLDGTGGRARALRRPACAAALRAVPADQRYRALRGRRAYYYRGASRISRSRHKRGESYGGRRRARSLPPRRGVNRRQSGWHTQQSVEPRENWFHHLALRNRLRSDAASRHYGQLVSDRGCHAGAGRDLAAPGFHRHSTRYTLERRPARSPASTSSTWSFPLHRNNLAQPFKSA